MNNRRPPLLALCRFTSQWLRITFILELTNGSMWYRPRNLGYSHINLDLAALKP
jgi:hypothetical protein